MITNILSEIQDKKICIQELNAKDESDEHNWSVETDENVIEYQRS